MIWTLFIFGCFIAFAGFYNFDAQTNLKARSQGIFVGLVGIVIMCSCIWWRGI